MGLRRVSPSNREASRLPRELAARIERGTNYLGGRPYERLNRAYTSPERALGPSPSSAPTRPSASSHAGDASVYVSPTDQLNSYRAATPASADSRSTHSRTSAIAAGRYSKESAGTGDVSPSSTAGSPPSTSILMNAGLPY